MPSPPDPRSRPSPWPAVWAYVAAVVLALTSSVLLVFAVAWVRVSGQRARVFDEAAAFAQSAPGLMAGALGNAAVLGAVARVAAHLQGRPISTQLRSGPTRATALGALEATAGLIGLSFACGAASELLGIRGDGVMDTMAIALRDLSPGRFLPAVLAIAVAPGLAEEMFFRGLMQQRLVASWGRWVGIVATAAAFGLIHLDPVQSTLAFVAGLYLGWMVERFGGIRPAIGAHVVNNAIFVALAVFGPAAEGSRLVKASILALGTSVFVASVWLLRQPRALKASRRAS